MELIDLGPKKGQGGVYWKSNWFLRKHISTFDYDDSRGSRVTFPRFPEWSCDGSFINDSLQNIPFYTLWKFWTKSLTKINGFFS
jgi:hypothetical protein